MSHSEGTLSGAHIYGLRPISWKTESIWIFISSSWRGWKCTLRGKNVEAASPPCFNWICRSAVEKDNPASTGGHRTVHVELSAACLGEKFVTEALRFCHLGSLVWSSTKLLPRMRVNYAHITNSGSSSINSFPPGCLNPHLFMLARNNNKWDANAHAHKSNSAKLHRVVLTERKVLLSEIAFASAWAPVSAYCEKVFIGQGHLHAEAQQLCLISELNRKAVDSASTLSLSVVGFSRCWWSSKWSATVLTIFVSSWNPQ